MSHINDLLFDSGLHKYRSVRKPVYMTGTESARVVRYYSHGDKFLSIEGITKLC